MSGTEITIRRMERPDLADVERIQAASPEASHWKPEDYLHYTSFVAGRQGNLVGFAVARIVPPDEIEILNLATDREARRQGVGRALLSALINLPGRSVFLEVRESNSAARALYKAAGFADLERRKNYYARGGSSRESPEDAIVMKLQK